jgi:hypothetical protein
MSRRRRILRAGGMFACSIFALLLWSKLKLVSGIPRTAYASPDPQAIGAEAPRPDPKMFPAPRPDRHAAGLPADARRP